MQYMDLCQLVNAIGSVEYLILKNLKINLFREDDEAGKVQKELKTAVFLLFIVIFILEKAITKNICELLRWKALKNFLLEDPQSI